MRLRQPRWFLIGLGLAASLFTQTAETAEAAVNFQCYSPHATIELGEFVKEFPTLINATNGPEAIVVKVNPVLPIGWGWQVCQTSTGICYFDEEVNLIIPQGVFPDTLRFDFFPNPGQAGMGYLQVTICDPLDPLNDQHCTFTLYNGLEDPEVSWSIDCSDNAYFTTVDDIKEFFCPLDLANPLEDQITIRPTADVPEGWGWQFCQTSTGVCYFNETTIPLTIGVADTLRVDFFMSGIDGKGALDLEMFSNTNPSIWRRCYYRVFRGAHPAGAPEVMNGAATTASYAQPNPFADGTSLNFRFQSAGRGDLSMYSADGREVRRIRDLAVAAGDFQVDWDGRSDGGEALPTGVYYYRLRTADEEAKGVVIRSH